MPNRLRRCTHCKDYGEAGDGITTPVGWFDDELCMMLYAKAKYAKTAERARKKAEADRKKDTRQRKDALKNSDIRHQHKLTQIVFNKMRRLQEFRWFADRGLEPECISCGKTGMDWCNGHLKTVGAHGQLRYDERNSYLQCNNYCNRNLSGNINGNKTTRGYLNGLVARFGEEEGKEIIQYCNSFQEIDKKVTCAELIEKRAEYSKNIRDLELHLISN